MICYPNSEGVLDQAHFFECKVCKFRFMVLHSDLDSVEKAKCPDCGANEWMELNEESLLGELVEKHPLGVGAPVKY